MARESLAARTVSLAVRVALGVGAVILLDACTVGRYYRGMPLRADPAQIVEGHSTRRDVLRLFGPPNTINHQTTGDAFIYLYEQRNSTTVRIQDPFTNINWFTYNRANEQYDRLVVLFDFYGVVQGVGHEHGVEHMPIY
jgi:outer membrane protein assembly factor BamE (lipoprotein component of BamABCDE complex)